jgi:hypothetical protein
MAYDIELVCFGIQPPRELEAAAAVLNGAQSEFRFRLPPKRLQETTVQYSREEYDTDTVYGWLAEYRRTTGGFRPFLIAVVAGPLRSAERGNLFGSHPGKDGVAVFTLHDHERYASTVAYCAYYLLRYAISFVSPTTKAHKEARGCFFDKKLTKSELRASLLAGRFCDPCKRAIEHDLNPEIHAGIAAMASQVKELEVTKRKADDIEVPGGEKDAARLGPWAYVWIALGALAITIGLLVFMVYSGDTLQRLGLSHRFYFVLLIPLAMSAGAFAFGAMRSTARFSGKTKFSGKIEATGVAVFMAAVVLAGFYVVPPEDTFNVLARITCDGAPVPTGNLLLQIDSASYSQPINGFGEAHFSDVPTKFRARAATVVLGAPGFKLHDPSTMHPLKNGILVLVADRDPSTLGAGGPAKPPIQPVTARTPNTENVQRERIEEVEGLRVRLDGCEKSNDAIVCRFTMTMVAEDRRVILWAKSRIVGRDGKERLARYIELGGVGRSVKRYGSVPQRLLEGIPITGSVRFSAAGIDTTIPLLELVTTPAQSVTFRDVDVR